MNKTIELFCGTKSFSKIAEEKGYEVFTLDNDPKFNSTIAIDIRQWVPFEGGGTSALGISSLPGFLGRRHRKELEQGLYPEDRKRIALDRTCEKNFDFDRCYQTKILFHRKSQGYVKEVALSSAFASSYGELLSVR